MQKTPTRQTEAYRAQCQERGLQFLREYDVCSQESLFLKEKLKLRREDLSFLYSRTDLATVRQSHKAKPAGESHLHLLLDEMAEIEQRLKEIKEQQAQCLTFVDEHCELSLALVIRGRHELKLSFSELGELFHFGRSTADRRYRAGLEELGQALLTEGRNAA